MIRSEYAALSPDRKRTEDGTDPYFALAAEEFSALVVRELDMGFTTNPFFDEATGRRSRGCQRISYCSCDCNHCTLVLL